ncbi:MAG: hypothetical protein NXH88_01645 [Hyphomonas sp.]|nr:hypothetical protein [Hyphomonas sp.]
MKTLAKGAIAISTAVFGVIGAAQAESITLELNGCEDTVFHDTIHVNQRAFMAVSACGQYRVIEFTFGKLQTVFVQPLDERRMTMKQVLVMKGLIRHPNPRQYLKNGENREHVHKRPDYCNRLDMRPKPGC